MMADTDWLVCTSSYALIAYLDRASYKAALSSAGFGLAGRRPLVHGRRDGRARVSATNHAPRRAQP